MKIALMLSGQGRLVDIGYNSYKQHILDNYDVDVFCQLWWDEEIAKEGYNGARNNFKVEPNLPDLINQLYNPKEFLIQKGYKTNNFDVTKSEIFDEFPYFRDKWPSGNHYLSQFLAIKNASNLLNWENYDFIIRTRYDLGLKSFPKLDFLNKKNFYPSQHSLGTLESDKIFFCDVMYILPNDMKNYLNVFDHLYEDDTFSYGYESESIWARMLDKLNYRDRLIKLKIDEFSY